MKDNVYVMQQENMKNIKPFYEDWSRTIWISSLHGTMTAFDLSRIMSSLFGTVLMAKINTDRYKYPRGKYLIKYF